MRDESKFELIIESLCYWLGYQFKIGRRKLIHEASFRYPVADTLTAQREIAIDYIQLEYSHPLFKRRRIDLALFNENSNISPNEIYEFKIARKEIDANSDLIANSQTIFDDLARLAYFNLEYPDTNCYLMVCGEFYDFKTYFVGDLPVLNQDEPSSKFLVSVNNPRVIKTKKAIDSWNLNGVYKSWFGFKINEEKVTEFIVKENESHLGNFQQDYLIREKLKFKYSNSIKIKTTCVAISSSSNIDKTHAAGIWKVEFVREE